MLRLPTIRRKDERGVLQRSLRTVVHGTCPRCGSYVADMSRLPVHLKLLHPLSAEFDALQRRTGS